MVTTKLTKDERAVSLTAYFGTNLTGEVKLRYEKKRI
tara:strand:- start:6 stop:116 length:111 start_codon:yes stop_codon:yes gene_type:complete